MTTNSTTYSKKSSPHGLYPVIVFLCTPRCGTQWLVKNLDEVYSNKAVVLHEPINNEYNLKSNLGRYDSSSNLLDNKRLNEHLDYIEKVTQNKCYIEVSWQSIAGIPEMYRRFGERLKLIHLYRNPIKVAASLVTHNWYTGKVEDRFEKSELNPFDDSAILKEYMSKWDNLDLFEKSLYYWTEINLRALEVRYSYLSLPYYSLKFEDLFKENKEKSRITLIEMLSFMGLTYDNRMLEAIDIQHDKYQYRSSLNINWENIFEHPQTIMLANKLGYHFDDEINLERYKKRSLKHKIGLKISSFIKTGTQKH